MSADVRSIAAVRDWHAALANYGHLLAESLAGVELEIRRAFDWLDEQRSLWQRAARECEEEVTQAKAELAARKFPDWSGRNPDTTVQEKALRAAKARLEHAEDQVVKVRSWIVRLPKLIEEVYRGPAQRLTSFLEADLPRGLASLGRRHAALEAYSGLRPDHAPLGPDLSAPAEPSSRTTPEPQPEAPS